MRLIQRGLVPLWHVVDEGNGVPTANSVQSGITEVMISLEIMVASHNELSFCRSLFCSLSPFGPVLPCMQRFSPSVTNLPFCKRMRRGAYASNVPIDSCGFSCRDSGRVGADVGKWFNPTLDQLAPESFLLILGT